VQMLQMLHMSTVSCGVWFVCRYPDGTYPSVLARNNWWGRNHVSFVAGRIWERRDDDNLIRVEYQPFLPDNTSVLHGTSVLLISMLLWLSYALHRGNCRILATVWAFLNVAGGILAKLQKSLKLSGVHSNGGASAIAWYYMACDVQQSLTK